MSNKVCCVPGCSSNCTDSKEVLHKFPNPAKDIERFRTWVYSVGGVILSLSDDHIFKYRRVCRRHFEDKYWCRNNLLSNIAIPTKNLSGLLWPTITSERRPLSSIQNLTEPSTSKETIIPMPHLDIAPQNQSQSAKEDAKNSMKCDIVTENPAMDVHQFLAQSSKNGGKKNEQDFHSYNTKVVRGGKTCIPVSKVEQLLHKKLVRTGIQLSKCRSKVKKQAVIIKAMQNIVSHPQLLKTLDNWSSTAKILTLLQFREHKKAAKGRRFTLEEKIMALSIFKQSPKGYRFFRKIFILPSPQILSKLLCMADIKPGINKKIMQQIKKATEKMKIEDRLCIVIFDEIYLKANVTYNERKDRVTGFVTNGQETRPEFADHAQVFLIRGLIKNYKQPVSYTFSQAATKGPELAVQLKEVISNLQEAGLIVVATVCDQGTNNMQCIKLLTQEMYAISLRRGEEPRNNVFSVNNQEVIPLYDPPHLIKCIRNNLITKDLQFETKTAKWSHILSLHNENPGYRGIRLVPKLSDFHCIPNKIPRQKVKYATQLLSQTVATNMGYLSDKGILSPECKDTADMMMFFDKLFDSVNGSFGKRKKFGKPLLGPATPTSIHHQVWEDSKKMLKKMKFINTNTEKVEYVPTLNNWVWTLEGIQLLLKKMHRDYGINSIWLRHLNQDPIENFFGSIRSHGCRNVNPSPENFESAFATLLVNSLSSVHAPGANCETDNCATMLTSVIITDSDCKEPDTCELENIPDITITPLEDKNDPREIGGLQYVCGYFLKKSKQNVFKGCSRCKKDLINKNEFEYIKYREYAHKKWLCSPSLPLLSCVSNLQDINYTIIKENLEKRNLSELIKTMILLFIDFDFISCEVHREDLIKYLLKISCRFFIFNYCKEINKIFNNKRDCDDDEDLFKIKAKKYFFKCFKRKNKQ